MEALDAAIPARAGGCDGPPAKSMLHFEHGNEESAVADIDEALRLEPEYAVAYYIRGTIHGYLKQHDRVIHDMTESLQMEPGNAQAWFHRGLAYGELDELGLAIDDLTEAIRLEPGNADAYRARGDCHRYRRTTTQR